MRFWCFAVLLTTWFRLSLEIEVTPNSECSSLCDDNIDNTSDPGDKLNSSTQTKDAVCSDYEFDGPNSTVRGRKFKDCMTCELQSTAIDSKSNENEVYWVLFNMKFTFDWCVFAYPNNNVTAASAQCGDICSGPNNIAQSALTDRLLQTNATIQYQYCVDGNGAFSKVADECAKCLEKVPNSKALVNYVNALNIACNQKPSPGELLKLDFDLFPPVSTSSSPTVTAGVITVTANPLYPPPSSPAASAASAASVSSVSAAAAASVIAANAAQATHDKNVRLGVGVGIGVGGVAAIVAVASIILWRRRSKRNRVHSEEAARARWEAEYHARHGPPAHQQDYKPASHELGAPYYVAEADEGRPRAAELSSPDNSSRMTSNTLRGSGMSRFMRKPPVPGKDPNRESAG